MTHPALACPLSAAHESGTKTQHSAFVLRARNSRVMGLGAMARHTANPPHARLKAWIERQQKADPGFSYRDFIGLLRAEDRSFRWAKSSLCRVLSGKTMPGEHPRLVIEAVTGIPAHDWLPANLRRAARRRAA
jgi:hypothetical protein